MWSTVVVPVATRATIRFTSSVVFPDPAPASTRRFVSRSPWMRRRAAASGSGKAMTWVTFTRKAAGELRERFQARLEREVRDPGDKGPEEIARVRQALD